MGSGSTAFSRPLRRPVETQWDDGYPIAPSRRYLAAMVLFLSNLMVVLDTTIANVSVPHIAGNLGATLDQGTWVITSYAVAEAICVPLSGWLALRFGEVRVFIVTLAGFTLFSLLCGMSVSLPMLVLCRLGQGFCGGPLMPLVQTLITRVFPPAQLSKAMAMWALTVMVGPAFGPVLGGFISDALSWHWIFLINVPLGIACAIGGAMLLRPVRTETKRVPIDKVGMALLVVWIGALQLMLDTGRDKDWFGSPQIVALAIIAVVGFCAFVIWEVTEEHPAVDVRLLANRPFAAVLIGISVCYGAFFSGTVILPQWLQTTMGYSSTKAGMLLAVSPLAAVISSQIALRVLQRFDARILVSIGCTLTAISFMIRLDWSTDIDTFNLAWMVMLQGFGMPFMMMPLTNMALSAVPMDKMASGAGLNAFTRTMAMAIAIAIVLTLWGNSQTGTRTELVGALNAADTMGALRQSGLADMAAFSYISGLVDRQAITLAMLHTNLIAAIATLLAGSAIWLVPRIELTRFKGGDDAGGH